MSFAGKAGSPRRAYADGRVTGGYFARTSSTNAASRSASPASWISSTFSAFFSPLRGYPPGHAAAYVDYRAPMKSWGVTGTPDCSVHRDPPPVLLAPQVVRA